MLNFWGRQLSEIEKKMCTLQKYSCFFITILITNHDFNIPKKLNVEYVLFWWKIVFPNVFDRCTSLAPLISLAHLVSHLILLRYIQRRNVKSFHKANKKVYFPDKQLKLQFSKICLNTWVEIKHTSCLSFLLHLRVSHLKVP